MGHRKHDDPVLSISTDYCTSRGSPEPYLRGISEAGFSHVHWCHEWNTDHLYSREDVQQIADWLGQYDLSLLDLHASRGEEKDWGSEAEDNRRAGVELIANRIEMAATLGSDVIVLHLPELIRDRAARLDAARRSLDELAPCAERNGVRIAIENMRNDDFAMIRQLFAEYDSNLLGLCYDSGHGNIGENPGLDHLDGCKNRLLAVHLHDNDGSGDQHNLIFSGTVNWKRLAETIAGSSYSKCVNMEVLLKNSAISDEKEFLANAIAVGKELSQMIETNRDRT